MPHPSFEQQWTSLQQYSLASLSICGELLIVMKAINNKRRNTIALTKHLAKKWRLAQRVLRTDGLFAFLGELFYKGIKPLLRLYEHLLWKGYGLRCRSSFSVLGHQLCVLPRDPGISQELAVHKVHEPLATHLLQQYLKPGMTVVDIGSNIGYYALTEARLVGENGRVIAIEPVLRNAKLLAKNVQANGYKNISIHEVAIGDTNGSAPLYVSQKSNWHTLHPVPWRADKIMVPVATLDELLKLHSPTSVDLVRMDLEGYEVVVLRGMLRTIETHSPTLLVELHPDLVDTHTFLHYLRVLKDLGYTPDWVFDQERDAPLRWLFLKPEKMTMEELIADSRITRDKRALTAFFSRKRVHPITSVGMRQSRSQPIGRYSRSASSYS